MTTLLLTTTLLASILVGVNNVLHQAVSNNIATFQLSFGDTFDVFQALQCVVQAAACVRRQVNLRLVTSDDDLRSPSHARQEHLHLRSRRILGFIENDERFVERTTTYRRAGRLRSCSGPCVRESCRSPSFRKVRRVADAGTD